MEDANLKYRLFEKHLHLLEKKPSHFSLASANISVEQFTVPPPPYPGTPTARRRASIQRKHDALLVCNSKPIVKPKLKNASCPACIARYLRDLLNAWVLSQRKPYSAITVQIDRLTSEEYEDGDIGGIPDLVEVIRIQDSGPTEAARAIRKKLKYGSPHRQLRALTILDGLIQNAGTRFQRTFADEPLLERLRILPRDELVDAQVRQKCNVLFRQWAAAYKNKPGLEGIASLYKQVPKAKRPLDQSQSKVLRETERDAQRDSSPPNSPFGDPEESVTRVSTASTASASSPKPVRPVTLSSTSVSSSSLFKRDKKGKLKPFNIEKEKTQMLETIAQSSVASTNLLNALKLINRENEQVSSNREVLNRFEQCKSLRRAILRYIQLVESEQWLGSLISANDELVKALMTFEIMDKSVEDDSDSDTEAHGVYEASKAEFQRQVHGLPSTEEQLAQLKLEEAPPAKPPRPGGLAMPPRASPVVAAKQRAAPAEEEDEDDPFGDSHAEGTPQVERGGMTW